MLQWLIEIITLEEIIKEFVEKGGKLNKRYLDPTYKGPSMVYFKRWYTGKNVREAIRRALTG